MAVQHVGGFFEEQARMLHPGEWPVNAGRLPQREIVDDPSRAGCEVRGREGQGRLPPIDSRPPATIIAMPRKACRSGVWLHST
ncbi:hypothetical protein RA8P1_00378 (plasmid) [Variovorax sp. RA8]|nr:hypothetical protein RA8P1_00378 [Variovorax sp. RA8]